MSGKPNIFSGMAAVILLVAAVAAGAQYSPIGLLREPFSACCGFLTRRYETVYDVFGGNEFLLTWLGTVLVSVTTYWTFACWFVFIDATGKPAWVHKYKVQQDKNIPVEPALLCQAIKGTLCNQILVEVPFAFAFAWLAGLRGCGATKRLPDVQSTLPEFLLFLAVEEIGFYYFHRLCHKGALYRRVHKRHHEYTAPFAVCNFDVHPVEHVAVNLLPMAAGPLLAGSHLVTTWLWVTVGMFSSLSAHSGYHLPFLPSNEAHDFHHLKSVNNFGVLGILDRLHGTDALFREAKNFKDKHTTHRK